MAELKILAPDAAVLGQVRQYKAEVDATSAAGKLLQLPRDITQETRHAAEIKGKPGKDGEPDHHFVVHYTAQGEVREVEIRTRDHLKANEGKGAPGVKVAVTGMTINPGMFTADGRLSGTDILVLDYLFNESHKAHAENRHIDWLEIQKRHDKDVVDPDLAKALQLQRRKYDNEEPGLMERITRMFTLPSGDLDGVKLGVAGAALGLGGIVGMNFGWIGTLVGVAAAGAAVYFGGEQVSDWLRNTLGIAKPTGTAPPLSREGVQPDAQVVATKEVLLPEPGKDVKEVKTHPVPVYDEKKNLAPQPDWEKEAVRAKHHKELDRLWQVAEKANPNLRVENRNMRVAVQNLFMERDQWEANLLYLTGNMSIPGSQEKSFLEKLKTTREKYTEQLKKTGLSDDQIKAYLNQALNFSLEDGEKALLTQYQTMPEKAAAFAGDRKNANLLFNSMAVAAGYGGFDTAKYNAKKVGAAIMEEMPKDVDAKKFVDEVFNKLPINARVNVLQWASKNARDAAVELMQLPYTPEEGKPPRPDNAWHRYFPGSHVEFLGINTVNPVSPQGLWSWDTAGRVGNAMLDQDKTPLKIAGDTLSEARKIRNDMIVAGGKDYAKQKEYAAALIKFGDKLQESLDNNRDKIDEASRKEMEAMIKGFKANEVLAELEERENTVRVEAETKLVGINQRLNTYNKGVDTFQKAMEIQQKHEILITQFPKEEKLEYRYYDTKGKSAGQGIARESAEFVLDEKKERVVAVIYTGPADDWGTRIELAQPIDKAAFTPERAAEEIRRVIDKPAEGKGASLTPMRDMLRESGATLLTATRDGAGGKDITVTDTSRISFSTTGIRTSVSEKTQMNGVNG